VTKQARRKLKNHFHNLLDTFWSHFNRARGRTEKLALLRQMAAVRVFNPAPYKERRNARLGLRVFGDCRVCSNDAKHRHHIIQVKNGGPNKLKNLILLCQACHCEIHPWMTVTLPREMAETMARVAREPDDVLPAAA
jgi:HNH endonuclease